MARPERAGYVDICVGERHSCAVTAGGVVHCWGSASQGELGVPGLRRSSVPVALAVPEAVAQLRCSQSLTCARTQSGEVYCWGDDRAMQVGPSEVARPPTRVPALAGASDLWVLPSAVCAVVAGALRCDGRELAAGELGRRHLRFVPVPQRSEVLCTLALDAQGATDVSCAAGRQVLRHGAVPRPAPALKQGGEKGAQTGSPPRKPSLPPAAEPSPPSPSPSLPWAQAGRRPGEPLLTAAFWGGAPCRIYASGPACDPLLLPRVQAALAGAAQPKVLAVSEDVLCLQRDAGEAACATWMGSRLAAGAAGLGPLRALALSETHACAVLQDGQARCWGEASHGELGDGTRYEVSTPQRVLGGAVELAVADDLSCARRQDGTLSCWGAPAYCDRDERCERSSAPQPQPMPEPAQGLVLGSPLSTRRLCVRGPVGWSCRFGEWRAVPSLPVPIVALTGGLLGQDGRTWDWAPSNPPERPRPHFFSLAGERVSALSPDGYCAVAAGGGVLCGHCGVCTKTEARAILTRLAEPADAVAVSRLIYDGGGHGVCVLSAAGRVQCSELGEAPWRRAEVQRPLLADVTGALVEVTAMAFADAYGQDLGQAGGAFGCLLHRDGSVGCLGSNVEGQLGDGSRRSRRQPGRVRGLPAATAIGVGRDHACALTRDGEVYCWGSARRGAVGVGRPVWRDEPVAVAKLAQTSSEAGEPTAP